MRMGLFLGLVLLVGSGFAQRSEAREIIHDAEHYLLEAQRVVRDWRPGSRD